MMSLISLCCTFYVKAHAQFSIHAGYAPEKWNQKTSLEEKHAVRYQGFYVNTLFSFENSLGGLALGPQIRYSFLGANIDLASFNGNLPKRLLIAEVPMLLYLRRYVQSEITTSWSDDVYIKRHAKIYPFIGVMPSYKFDWL